MSFATPNWDLKAFVWINQRAHNQFLDAIMPILSQQVWLWLLLGAVVTILLVRAGNRKLVPVLFILLAVGLTDLTTNVIKKTTGRVRPLDAVAETRFIDKDEWRARPADFVQTKKRSGSFPSAHAANSMVVAVLIMAGSRPLRPWMFLLPLLVGYSRIYLGKHYPSDVLAGWFIGLALCMAYYPVATRLTAWAQRTAPTPKPILASPLVGRAVEKP